MAARYMAAPCWQKVGVIAPRPFRPMSGVKLEFRPILSSGHLKEPLQLRSVEKVDGRLFFKAVKGDHVIARLLLGQSFHNERVLAKTDILERLQSARNDMIDSMINPVAKNDLGLDDGEDEPRARKAMKRLPADLPSIIKIEANLLAAFS